MLWILQRNEGIKIRFQEADLGDVHPNTVNLLMKGKEGTYEVIGSSIGGGSIDSY